MNPDLQSIFAQFKHHGSFIGADPYGRGHINDTFLVTTSGSAPNYLLQRINHNVFRNVPLLMANIKIVTAHLRKKTQKNVETEGKNQVLTFISTVDEKLYYEDDNANYWRLCYYIDNSHAYDVLENAEQAYKGGKAFGRFLALLADLPPQKIGDTIPFFHDVAKRLETFNTVLEQNPKQRVARVEQEIKAILSRAAEMQIILQLGKEGKIPQRITHNDTKFNNILFDQRDEVLCVIDLDTVMPGYVHYDFGDAIRTGTNNAPEDEEQLDRVSMDLDLFAGFARGFLEETFAVLNATEIDYLAFSAKLLTYIMALRFLTDYIAGDTYYKISHPQHNLQRTRAQLKLLESMDLQYEKMKDVVNGIVDALSS